MSEIIMLSFHCCDICLCLQVAAKCLGVAPEKVFISETSSATVANSSPTAASFSTDLNGMAVKVGQGWPLRYCASA